MRGFLSKLALFSLPFWGLFAFMSLREIPKERAYEQILKDCRSGSWIYRRIHENPKPIDLALIGTSRTMCALEDDILQSRLNDSLGLPWTVANLGVCRNGVNLHWYILRDLLSRRKPKAVVVELHSVMPANSHMHFPMVASAKDVYLPGSALNSAYFADLATFSWTRLCYLREHILGIDYDYPEEITNPDHSFVRVPNDMVADSAEMVKVRNRRKVITSQDPEGLAGAWRGWVDQFPQAYYRSMAEMCKSARVPLYFLYIPGYGTEAPKPQSLAFYESLAPVLIAPDTIFSNPKHFFDPDHLNQKGARLLTDWVAEEMAGRNAP